MFELENNEHGKALLRIMVKQIADWKEEYEVSEDHSLRDAIVDSERKLKSLIFFEIDKKTGVKTYIKPEDMLTDKNLNKQIDYGKAKRKTRKVKR